MLTGLRGVGGCGKRADHLVVVWEEEAGLEEDRVDGEEHEALGGLQVAAAEVIFAQDSEQVSWE